MRIFAHARVRVCVCEESVSLRFSTTQMGRFENWVWVVVCRFDCGCSPLLMRLISGVERSQWMDKTAHDRILVYGE